ncbi:ATP-binding protein [Lachnospiraceae bacterium 38-14]|jgi:Signal transduction histidine kinase|nr:ATP-binding protein [Lachnospiraceae bacterium]
MPGLKKWRDLYFKVDYIVAAATFLLEVIMFFFLNHMNLIKESIGVYLMLFLVIPTVLNASIIGVANIFRKRLPQEDKRQNDIAIMALVLICTVISVTHCAFFNTLTIFCIPIFMTTVFGEKNLCRKITIISVCSIIAATVKHYFTAGNPDDRVWYFPECLLAVTVVVIVEQVALKLLKMLEGQKRRLIDLAETSKEAHRREKAANEAKSVFLANMSHEIRTPINAVLGMNEMILRETENPQILEYADNIQSAGNLLLSLINDVLDFSKVESGKLDIVEAPYETSSFLHDSCSMMGERASKKGLEFRIACDFNLPCRLLGDEFRIRQIVTNLLSNAVKYTEKGSVTFSVESRQKEEAFYLIITVEDTGMGIREENIKDLFSQFTRFHLEKNRHIEGTGLGLAITKQLLDLMHGDIQVESTYGEGSVFTVTIPQQVVDDAPVGDFLRHYRDVTRDNSQYRQSFEAENAKILVVDDVAVNLKVIANLLKKTKIQVDTAESGPACIEMASKNTYDIIFMDHMMPEMDGVETYKKMQQLKDSPNAHTPVIMLTANAINGVKEEYLKDGFVDYLSKPVRGDKLERMILNYLPEDKIDLRINEDKE